jgi:hypothetical protein
MDRTPRMLDRIPNIDGFDAAGNVVENFNYSANLMFSCSMPILEGSFEAVMEKVAGAPSRFLTNY